VVTGGLSGLPAVSEPVVADLLIEGGPLLTADREERYWPAGSVAISGAEILDVGPRDEVRRRVAPRQVLDAGRMAILPGFVSCHGHAGMTLLRGLAEDYPLEAWLRSTVWPIMRHAGPEETFAGAQLACLEMLRSGITTFADMWRDLDATADAVAKSGLRARLAFNMRDFGDSAALEAEWAQGLDALDRTPSSGRISYGLAPHSLYACSNELLRRAGEELRSRSCHLQIHLAETRAEVEDCRARHGAGPVERLAAFGLLGPGTLIAHGVWLDEADCRVLAAGGASIAHNVTSNLKLASGVAPLSRFRSAGLNFGLGTDSAASNNVLDPFREMRLAVLMQRAVAEDPSVMSAYDAIKAATIDGARALGLDALTGSLEPGKRADLVLIDLDKPHLQPLSRTDCDATSELVVFAATADDVDTVIVDGQIVMKSREVLTLAPGEVLRVARDAASRLLRAAAAVEEAPLA
jgi:5-methylthioadenosine/S-adenosylhomocysteine deaminase